MKSYQALIISVIFIIFIFLNNQVPECKTSIENENNFFRVIGNSMYPSIKNNSFCRCYEKEDYNVRDIVIYYPLINEEYVGVSHRIIKINNNSIYLKGDNNNFIEGPIEKENIRCYIPSVPTP